MRTRTYLARWSVIVVPAIAIVTACSDTVSPTSPHAAPSPATALLSSDGSIPGNYIVVANWSADVLALTAQYGIKPKYVYEHLKAAEEPQAVHSEAAAKRRVLI